MLRPWLVLALAVLLLPGPAPAQDRRPAPLAPVRSQFDPRLDGLPFGNFGDYTSADGICFGMSLLAIDNYLRRMAARRAGEPDPAPLPITDSVQQGHLEYQRLAALAHAVAARQDDGARSPANPETGPLDPRPMRAALERIRRSGVPEPMGIYKGEDAHAIVLFGFEEGRLLIYDPNYPGETIRWPWDPVRGLGPHPKRRDDAFYRVTGYEVTPWERFRTARELPAIRDACARGLERCVARFPQLRARVEGGEDGPRHVVGRLEGGLRRDEDGGRVARPRRVWVVVDGKPVAVGPIGRDGTFRVRLPGPPGGRVQLVAVTQSGALAGLNDLDPPEPAPSRGFTAALGER